MLIQILQGDDVLRFFDDESVKIGMQAVDLPGPKHFLPSLSGQVGL